MHTHLLRIDLAVLILCLLPLTTNATRSRQRFALGDIADKIAQCQLVARTAQDFVDAVRSLQEDADTVISIPAGTVINLTDPLTLKPLTVDEVSAGSLTIRGGVGGTQPSVLHLGWRSNVSVRCSSSIGCSPCRHHDRHHASPTGDAARCSLLPLTCAHVHMCAP